MISFLSAKKFNKVAFIIAIITASLIATYTLLDEKTVKKIKNNGFKIYTWTVNNKDDINFIKKLKVDGIISDYPDRI